MLSLIIELLEIVTFRNKSPFLCYNYFGDNMKIFLETNGSLTQFSEDKKTCEVIEEVSRSYGDFNIISIIDEPNLEDYKPGIILKEIRERHKYRTVIGRFDSTNHSFPLRIKSFQTGVPGIFEINDFAVIYYPEENLGDVSTDSNRVNILTDELPHQILVSYFQTRRCGVCETNPPFNDKTFPTKRYIEVSNDDFIKEIRTRNK